MTGIFRLIRLPDLISLLNALLGFGAILMAFQGRLSLSVVLIFLAAAADGVDGFMARRTKTGLLGVNLDSLADAISFGLAPAVLASLLGDLFWVLGGVYLSCGILRLARFNITPKEEKVFEGMPIPAGGMTVAVSVLFDEPLLTALLMLVLSGLMISTLPYPKFRDPRLTPFALAVGVGAMIGWQKGHLDLAASMLFLVLICYLIFPLVILCRRRER
jgi:archaetidylserine synthase